MGRRRKKKSNGSKGFMAMVLLAALTILATKYPALGNLISASTEQTHPKQAYEIPIHSALSNDIVVSHTGFTLSYNSKHNTPNWVAWQLDADKTDGPIERSTKFWADPAIPTVNRVDWYEYQGSSYDRGHMCPAGDMKWSAEAMHDCFYMSNMCPQVPSLNSGSWKRLEESCRKWAKTEGKIYIVCGPIYQGKKHEHIGVERSIDVPEAFFKAVLSLRPGHEKAIGFYYTNTEQKQSLSKAALSIDELEKQTGFDFFSLVEDELETAIESSFNLTKWQ